MWPIKYHLWNDLWITEWMLNHQSINQPVCVQHVLHTTWTFSQSNFLFFCESWHVCDEQSLLNKIFDTKQYFVIFCQNSDLTACYWLVTWHHRMHDTRDNKQFQDSVAVMLWVILAYTNNSSMHSIAGGLVIMRLTSSIMSTSCTYHIQWILLCVNLRQPVSLLSTLSFTNWPWTNKFYDTVLAAVHVPRS